MQLRIICIYLRGPPAWFDDSGDTAALPEPTPAGGTHDHDEAPEFRVYIAMNHFNVCTDQRDMFGNNESIATSSSTPCGLLASHLLERPMRQDNILFFLHAAWRSNADFDTWTSRA